MAAGTTSIREHCTGNVPSKTSYSLGVLTRSATADFPGVRLDEARPGLPTSVDGHTVIFVTTSSTLASTPVEVCCFIVLEDAVFMSAPVDIAFTYDETEDCISSFHRLVTTTTSLRNFDISEHQPPHRQRYAVSLCSFISTITRTGGLS